MDDPNKTMIGELIDTIASNTSFGIVEVARVYNIFKSFDLLIQGCEFCQRTGSRNLEIACVLARGKTEAVGGFDSADIEIEQGENVFHIEYVDADHIRLTKV